MTAPSRTANSTNGVNSINGHRVSTSELSPALDKPVESEGGDVQAETEFLIVGCGPAGASLACFLGSHGELWATFLCSILTN